MNKYKKINTQQTEQANNRGDQSKLVSKLRGWDATKEKIPCSVVELLEQSQGFVRDEDYESAIELLEMGVEAWPQNIPINGVLADCYRKTENYTQSARYYDIVVNCPQPTPVWALVGYANVLESKNEFAGALEYLTKALKVQYSPELSVRTVRLSTFVSSVESVAAVVQAAIDDQVDDSAQRANLYLLHGDLFCELKQWVLACEFYDKSHQAEPDLLRPITGKLKVLLRNRFVDQASLIINEWKSTRPGDARLKRFERICNDMKVADHVRSIAFFLPQYHPVPENNEWWGEGFTEWHNVASAKSMWNGHIQPRLPTDLGYYDLRLPETYNKQTELASKYGVNGFCFYYYWFNGRKILDTPLQNVLDGKTSAFPFCICWVNEDWTRSWDGMSGEVLLSTSHSEEMNMNFIKDVYPILSQDDYIRVDGKPLLVVYCAEKLDVTDKTTKMWRKYCQSQGLGDIYIVAVQSFGFGDPTSLGYDAAMEFPPHAVGGKDVGESHVEIDHVEGLHKDFKGKVYSYQEFADCAMSRPKEKYTLHRTCMLAWDNTARRGKEAHAYAHFSVEKYQHWLTENMRKAVSEQDDPVVFINAWNEWAEGSTLEPDKEFGHELLAATRRAKRIALWNDSSTYWKPQVQEALLSEKTNQERILMIGHDAHRNGAQINFLYMVQNLVREKKKRVTIILKEGGELVSQYEQYGKVYVIGAATDHYELFQGIISDYLNKGTTKAICNTCVTGDYTKLLNQTGYKVISLVHELPGIISHYGLKNNCELLAQYAHRVVFASQYVAEKFAEVTDLNPGKTKILVQGIKKNSYILNKARNKLDVRTEFGIPVNAKIVIGCGYGDMRKGIDYFVHLANSVTKENSNIYFIWIGELQSELGSFLEKDISQVPEGKFIITGFRSDTGKLFSAADVFALTSREDPFPSVVMEAMEVGLPVYGFEGCGGYGSIVDDRSGGLIPYGDIAYYSGRISEIINDNQKYSKVSKYNSEYSAANFGYSTYMQNLLDLAAVGEVIDSSKVGNQTVTAIIPNYNYSQYLKLRLKTVAEQTKQPDEIIILDDKSTDNSLEVINKFVEKTNIKVKVIESKKNSGNVFVQWKKGIDEASCDLIWIAEADDYCDQEFLERMCIALISKDTVISTCNSIMVDGFGNSFGVSYDDYLSDQFGSYFADDFEADGLSFVNEVLVKRNAIMNASAVVFRRSAAIEATKNLGELRLSGDWLFWVELCLRGNISYKSNSYNYHRRHSNSVVGKALQKKTEIITEMLKMVDIISEFHTNRIPRKSLDKLISSVESTYEELFSSDTDYVSIDEHPVISLEYAKHMEQQSLDVDTCEGKAVV